MATGIIEVTQDPEKAGSALKVLSLRLRGKNCASIQGKFVCFVWIIINPNTDDNYICQNARVRKT